MNRFYNEVDPRVLGLAAETAGMARAAGADFADVTISTGRQVSVAVEANDIRLCEQHETWSCSVRSFVGGGMAIASGDGPPTLESLRQFAEQSVQMARLASPDPDFVDLPAPAAPLVPNSALALSDSAIAALALADAVRIARDSITRVLDLDPAILVNGDVGFSVGGGVLATSTGIVVANTGTFGEVSLFAVARDGDDVGSFSEYTMGRHWSDLKIEPLAGLVVRGARMYQHARPCKPGAMTLLLGPLAAFGLVGAVAAAASSEAIRRKRSLLMGRLAKPIASPRLTLRDCPLEVGGVGSGAFDAEGSPRRPVTIIDWGVFAESLTNHYNARLAGLANNGHGTRRGAVSATNLQVAPGNKTEAELIREIDDGIYLQAGSLDPDLASGDISAALDFAYKIDRGQLTYPLAGAMAAGSLLDLLARIDAVSSDYRSDPGLVMPSIRIPAVQFSGGA